MKVVSPTNWWPPPAPALRNITRTHFCKRLNRHEDHSAAGRINSLAPSGIEPATFRLAEQSLKQLLHHAPPKTSRLKIFFAFPKDSVYGRNLGGGVVLQEGANSPPIFFLQTIFVWLMILRGGANKKNWGESGRKGSVYILRTGSNYPSPSI